MNTLTTAITRSSNTSFYYSFSLLPRQKREAIHTVYAFCRYHRRYRGRRAPGRTKKVVLLGRWRMELGRALRGEIDIPAAEPVECHRRPVQYPRGALLRAHPRDGNGSGENPVPDLRRTERVLLSGRIIRRVDVPEDLWLPERVHAGTMPSISVLPCSSRIFCATSRTTHDADVSTSPGKT